MLRQLARAVRDRRVSARELTERALRLTEERNPALNAVIAPIVNAGRCSRRASSTTFGSNRYARTSGAGTSMLTAMWPIRPVMWKSGAMPKIAPSLPACTRSR